ncbi:MAG: head-tail connector protein [Spirochaetales bacterium]|nr:head-tail connector protein [Spirochaetales bacterium]
MEEGYETKEQQILRKFEALKDDRQTWEQEYEDISEYIFPRRNNWDTFDGKARRQGAEIYDGTPIGALNLLANGLVGYLVSPATRWFKLRLPTEQLTNLPGVRAWLEKSEQVLYDEFSRSNFYEEIVEYFKDGGAFGTATMYVEEDLNRNLANFSTRHPKEIYLATNRYGQVDTVFRRFVMTARQMAEQFGEESLSPSTQRMVHDQPQSRIKVIHAVYPRTDRDVTKLNNKNMPYASAYIEEDASFLIRESGFQRLPYIVWRYSTNSDETYGRGPGYEALSDVKKSNKVSETLLKSAQMMVDPPLNVPEQMKNKVKWVPRGLNYYANPKEVVTPANTGKQYDPGLEREQHLKEIIETHFMVDFFLMLERAPDGMTATEVMERQAEKAAILGSTIGRIASEFLDPVIDHAFEIAFRQRKLPAPPPALIQAVQTQGAQLEIDYIGPLSQAQKKFHVTRGVNQSIQALAPVMQMNPQVADLVDWDQLGMEIMRSYGMPEKVIRDLKQVQQMRKQRQQQQQQMMQQQQANETMKALPNEMPEDGTAMNSINKQLAAAISKQNPDEGLVE